RLAEDRGAVLEERGDAAGRALGRSARRGRRSRPALARGITPARLGKDLRPVAVAASPPPLPSPIKGEGERKMTLPLDGGGRGGGDRGAHGEAVEVFVIPAQAGTSGSRPSPG